MAGLPAATPATSALPPSAPVPPRQRHTVHAFPGEAGRLLDGGVHLGRGAVRAGPGRAVPADAGEFFI